MSVWKLSGSTAGRKFLREYIGLIFMKEEKFIIVYIGLHNTHLLNINSVGVWRKSFVCYFFQDVVFFRLVWFTEKQAFPGLNTLYILEQPLLNQLISFFS